MTKNNQEYLAGEPVTNALEADSPARQLRRWRIGHGMINLLNDSLDVTSTHIEPVVVDDKE